MKVPSHLIGLYNRTVRRYKKLAIRLRREQDPEGYAYLTILRKLKKLRRELANLRLQLKVAVISGVLLLGAGIAAQGQTTHPGPFVLQPRHLNPLREPFIFYRTTYPAVADVDKDGDLDVLVADGVTYYENNTEYSAPLHYLVNTGSNANPVYEEKTGDENPFATINVNNRHRGVVFADIDEDGDQDLFIGLTTEGYNTSSILYYRNENGKFEQQTTPWNEDEKTGNPFLGIEVNDHQKLAFADLNGDTHPDAIITGTHIDPLTGMENYISYYKNNGKGTFSDATGELVFSPAQVGPILNPALADVDGDGNTDLVLGGNNVGLRYYRQVSPGNFVEQTGAYDAVNKTGNPFDGITYSYTQPAFADMDDDGDVDLFLSEGDKYNTIHVYENTGNAVFREKTDLDNPLGGVYVKIAAAPVLLDLDGDADMDALIGHKYNLFYDEFSINVPVHYEFEGGAFTRKDTEHSPFGTIEIGGQITPALADLDGDGNLEFITGSTSGNILYFKKDNEGNYVEHAQNNPFAAINFPYGSSIIPDFADIDGDGDLDLIFGVYFLPEIFYYENVGGPEVPVFEERTGEDNPFNLATDDYVPDSALDLADIDHDGDIDLLAIEYGQSRGEESIITYYENTGTKNAAHFERAQEQPFPVPDFPFAPYSSSVALQPYLADQDGDGDLDLFVGDAFGEVRYIKNENPAVVTALASGAAIFRVGVDDDTIIDPTLSLSDEDDDLVVMATVTIGNFEQGDELQFAVQQNIAGVFDRATGVLTLTGKATRQTYQDILRTVTYRRTEAEGGRMMPRKKSITAKPVDFRVYDSDFTHPQMASRNVNVIFNEPPIVESTTETTQAGSMIHIDLNTLISDVDGNLDLSTLKVVGVLSSGATAVIDADHTLIIDYTTINFVGVDLLTIEVCDDLGECSQNIITIDVTSAPRVDVYNAVAPTGIGDNRYMRIHNLPERNLVTIFSRWGDKVFEVENYDSNVPGKRFEGRNNSGNLLSAGTYFYKIEIPNTRGYFGPKLITGYITLKR